MTARAESLRESFVAFNPATTDEPLTLAGWQRLKRRIRKDLSAAGCCCRSESARSNHSSVINGGTLARAIIGPTFIAMRDDDSAPRVEVADFFTVPERSQSSCASTRRRSAPRSLGTIRAVRLGRALRIPRAAIEALSHRKAPARP